MHLRKGLTIGLALTLLASPDAGLARSMSLSGDAYRLNKSDTRAHTVSGKDEQDRAAAPSGDVAQFFGTAEYPPEAVRKGEQGRVVASLAIDETGHVVDCKVIESSGSTALDVRTCVVAIGRVRFAPALDKAGRPKASTYTLPVRWVLPADFSFAARQSLDEVVTLEITADDRVERCQYARNGQLVDEPGDACAMWSGAQLSAFRAQSGPGHVALKLQYIVQFVGPARSEEVHKTPGYVIFRLGRAIIDILPDGSAANQRVIETAGSGRPFNPIASLARFEPAVAPMQVEILSAISYRLVP